MKELITVTLGEKEERNCCETIENISCNEECSVMF